MPNQSTYRSQVLDYLGLVAGMFDELAIGDIIDQATQQNPEKEASCLTRARSAVRASTLMPLTTWRLVVSTRAFMIRLLCLGDRDGLRQT